MLNRIEAFADEFGNNSFDFNTQGTHFIVATVISKNVPELEKQIAVIRRKHNFQTEVKSSKVADNHNRRIRVLEDIAQLDFSVYAVVIDKRELTSEGFGYKKSFYKFMNNLLYRELFRTFPQLTLHVDEHGSNKFMLEFKRYVAKHHLSNLFSGSEFNISNSKNEECIQLADFVAGTLGYIFDEKKKSSLSDKFLELLRPKISGLNQFPRKLTFPELADSNIDDTFDSRIAEVCFMRIQYFLDTTKGDTQQVKDQINFIKLLLWFQRAYPRSTFIKTAEVLNHLNQSREEPIQQEYFRSKIVGALRDRGILIASGRQGYKIPSSASDIDSFVTHGKGIVIPMLNRIKEARNALLLATQNEFDILDKPKYASLKKLLD